MTGIALLSAVVAAMAVIACDRVHANDLLDANVAALAGNENPDRSFNKVKINENNHSITCKGDGHQCCRMN